MAYTPEVSDAPLTIAEISGSWSYSDGLGYSASMTIATDGIFSFSATDGCTASGQISELDTTINIYEFEYDLNCPPGANNNPNGVRAGLAFVDDHWSADTWLIMAGAIGNFATHLALSRPRPIAATKSGNTNAAEKLNYAPPRFRRLLTR